MGVMDPDVENQMEKCVEIAREELEDFITHLRAAEYAKAGACLYHLAHNMTTVTKWIQKHYSRAEWDELAESDWRPEGIDRWLSKDGNQEYYDERMAKQENDEDYQRMRRIEQLIGRLLGE